MLRGEELVKSFYPQLIQNIIRATAILVRKDAVPEVSIQTHLLDLLWRKDLYAAHAVHKLPDESQQNVGIY